MQVKISKLIEVNEVSTLNGRISHSIIADAIDLDTKTIISLSSARASTFSINSNQFGRRLDTSDDTNYHISSNPIRLQLKCSKSLSTMVILQTNNNEHYGYNLNSTSQEYVTTCILNQAKTYQYDCKYYDIIQKVSVTCSGKNETIIAKCPSINIEPLCYSSVGQTCSLAYFNASVVACKCQFCNNHRRELGLSTAISSYNVMAVTKVTIVSARSKIDDSTSTKNNDMFTIMISSIIVGIFVLGAIAAVYLRTRLKKNREKVTPVLDILESSTSIVPHNKVAPDLNDLIQNLTSIESDIEVQKEESTIADSDSGKNKNGDSSSSEESSSEESSSEDSSSEESSNEESSSEDSSSEDNSSDDDSSNDDSSNNVNSGEDSSDEDNSIDDSSSEESSSDDDSSINDITLQNTLSNGTVQ